ncbi:MAG: metallophosphoesterase [Planctomycetes bacterium]|nr:metallophosphoesterase [Planctomycetota bacterium]
MRLHPCGLYLLALSPLAGCTVDRGLIGLPQRQSEDALHQAELLTEDVRAIERAIEHEFGSPTPGEAPRDPLRYHAYRAALEVQIVIAAEHFDYLEQNQRADPGRPPARLYPRTVLPAIPAPTVVRDAEGREEVRWFVPVVLNKAALYWSDDFESRWFGVEGGRVSFDRPEVHFETFLVPHGDAREHTDGLYPLRSHLVPLEPREITLAGCVEVHLPNLIDEHAVFVAAPRLRSAEHPDGIAPGFYDLRHFPALELGEGLDESWGELSGALRRGDWFAAKRAMRAQRIADEQSGADPDAWLPWLERLLAAIENYPPRWFDSELERVERDARVALDADRDARFAALVMLERGIRHLAITNDHPAPVLLEAPSDKEEPFSFVVGADLQYTSDLTWVRQFLGMLDGSFLPHSGVEQAPHAMVAQPVLDRVRQAKFVVVVGDLSDGAALSSTPGAAVGSALGLTPPGSPYGDDFTDLQKEFARFRLPVFAVPGNHDGFASYGGFFNDVCAAVGDLLAWDAVPFPLHFVTHPLGRGLHELGSVLPTVVKLGRLANKPYFDGLVEWRYRLGPVHFAFRYRGHSFAGLNSYNLDVMYRDQIGPLANNWGGGVDRQDAVWFDLMLRWMRERNAEGATGPDELGHQFAFLHHDPRAGRPYLRTYQEADFGGYDAADAPINAATFGYLGLGWSAHNPLWLPIITPIMTSVPRQIAYGDSKFNQEWMLKDSVFDGDHYGARQLVEAITWNLDGPSRTGGLSHLFFGHDDVPARSKWIHDEQAGRVFPAPQGEEWPAGKWSFLGGLTTPFLRQRTVAPAPWGRELRREDGHNAVVMRCDDVGQRGSMHGFYLVTVDPRKPRAEQIAVEWIQIPG